LPTDFSDEAKFKEANLGFRRMGPRPGDVMFGSTADTQRFKAA